MNVKNKKSSKNKIAKKHLIYMERELRKNPNNRYFKNQVLKTKSILGR